MTKPFITNKDYEEFAKHNDNLEEALGIFLKEIKEYFNTVWDEKYHIHEELTNIEQLNKNHLLDYPSTGGYHVLEDSFTGPNCPVELLSEKSQIVLGYFYGIHLH